MLTRRRKADKVLVSRCFSTRSEIEGERPKGYGWGDGVTTTMKWSKGASQFQKKKKKRKRGCRLPCGGYEERTQGQEAWLELQARHILQRKRKFYASSFFRWIKAVKWSCAFRHSKARNFESTTRNLLHSGLGKMPSLAILLIPGNHRRSGFQQRSTFSTIDWNRVAGSRIFS